MAIVSMPQLMARMIMERHDTPLLFSLHKHDALYIFSPAPKQSGNWDMMIATSYITAVSELHRICQRNAL